MSYGQPKMLISGGDGKFATQIIESNRDLPADAKYQIFAPSKEEMDITDAKVVEEYVSSWKPDVFLHAAAYTRPMAKHYENPDKSIQINIIGTANIVLSCMRHNKLKAENECSEHNDGMSGKYPGPKNIKFVYVSTDYVYPGTEGNYQETSPLLPYSKDNVKDGCFKYGWSKLGGEAAAHIYDNSLILRVCMCNSPFPHNKALADVKKSLIYDKEAARITLQLLDETGIINIGGEPQTIHEFAKKDNPGIEKMFIKGVKDVSMAPNITMNIDKLKNTLGENYVLQRSMD